MKAIKYFLPLTLTVVWPLLSYAQNTKISVHPERKKIVYLPDRAKDQEVLRQVAGNTHYKDQSSWSQKSATTVKDITDYIPGVYAQPRNGAESSRLSIRGSGLANTFQGRGLMVMQDGVPINMADGEFEFPVIDPWLIDSVQVLPGANALADGASTLGGGINFITPTGISAPNYRLRGQAGSFSTLQTMASAGKNWQGTDIFAAASGFNQQGFRTNNEQDISRFNANLGWLTNNNLTQRIYASHTVSNAEIPGALSKAEIAADPSQSNPLNRTNHYQRDLDITRIAHKAAWEDGANRLETTLYYTNRTLDNPVTTYINEDNKDGGVRIKYSHESGLDKWISGINFGYGTQNESRYTNINAHKGAHILDRDLNAISSEAYAELDKHLFRQLYGIADFQFAYSSRNIKETFPLQLSQDKDYFGYNPRIGLRYDFDAETQFFGNLSCSFEPPTWGELSGGNSPGFNDLNAQTASTGEIGIRRSDGNTDWSAAIYRTHLKNEFVNYRFADGSTDTINADKSVHDGFELGAEKDVAQNVLVTDDTFHFRMTYLWSYFHLKDDNLYSDNILPGMPEHYVRGELIYNHPNGFFLGPNIEWAPKSYPIDLTNTQNADGYAIYGLRAGWTGFSGNVETFIEGRNLNDRSYTATTNVVPDVRGRDGRYFYPGEGRAVYAGLRVKF